jgi:putative serine protease PepD
MRSALLGGVAGAVVAAGVMAGAGALGGDDEPAATTAAPPAATQAPGGADGEQGAAAQTDVGRIYEQASPATVSIRAGRGTGTGFLVDAKGLIVTNAHVVARAEEVQIRFGPDEARIDARVIGRDPGADLALLRIAQDEVPEGVEPLELADSDRVGVGETVVAIGNPFGLPRTATVGIVSALGRTITAPNGFSIPGAVQTDAAINPGNSGGPLLDSRARVIGVNSQIQTTSGVFAGIGFAVPSNTVRDVVPVLERDGEVRRGYLGVSTSEPEQGQGARVEAVVPGGPAARAGVRAGDLVTAIDGEEVLAPDDVSAAVVAKRQGEEVELRLRRGGQDRTVTVTLGAQPERSPNAPAGPR